MKKLKRLLVLLLSSCIGMFGITACNSDSETGKEKQTDKYEDTDENDIVSVKRPIDYGEKQDTRTFEGMEVAESELYVEPIEGISDKTFRGVDVSSYIVQKDSGVKYYDFDGNELDDAGFFNFLADSGVNWVRVRVWNNPYNDEGIGYGGGNNDVEKAIAIGKLATNAGMRVLIDFHYSDFWADPNNQRAPKEWANKSFTDKKKLIFEFTTESINKLKAADVDVGMVQIGNEINNGMAGETDEQRVFELMKEATKAIRAIDKNIKIGVHYTDPQNVSFPNYAGRLIDAGVDYDVFCASYYPFWHGNLGMLSMNLKAIIENFSKEVMVVETSYIYTKKDGDGHPNSVSEEMDGVTLPYEASPQGQVDAIRDVLETVVKLGDKGLGVCYWEPAWIPVQYCSEDDKEAAKIYQENKAIWREHGSGWASGYAGNYDSDEEGKYYGGTSWDNQALFDFNGKPLESINVFKYVFSGTTAKKLNYVENEGFENSDMTSWTIEGVGVKRQEGNDMRSGTGCLHFWNDKTVQYTVTQKIENILPGTYELSAFLQGGDAGSSAIFELFIQVNGEEFKDSLGVTGWQKWEKGIISDIVIPEGAEVIVGVRAKAIAGAWGAWDDFALYKID